jgi:2-keto-4-pentenoate hydratase
VIPETDRRAAAAAERDRAPIGPPTRKWPGPDAVDACEIQLINVRERLARAVIRRKLQAGSRLRGLVETQNAQIRTTIVLIAIEPETAQIR